MAIVMLGEMIERSARRDPNKLALASPERRFTYAQFRERVNRLANGLLSLGAQKGDRVAVLSQNCSEYIEIYCAAAKAGLVIAPLNWRFVERELVAVINHVEPHVLVLGAGCSSVVEAMRSQIPSVKSVVCFGGTRPGMEDYEALIARSPAMAPSVSVSLEDLACLIHTSGTTGMPKEVMWSHRNWLAGVIDVVTEMRIAHTDIGLHVVPAFHITFAWPMLAYLYWGCTQVVLPRFDPGVVLETVEKERITSTFWVPTMISTLLEDPSLGARDLSSLNLVMYGGSTISPSVLERAVRAFGPVFMQVYGLSEQSGAFTRLTREEHTLQGTEPERRRLASCGKEMLSDWVRVVDDQGRDVAPGQMGEIIAKGPNIMEGYWRDPEHTAQALRDGWLFTGDLATVDEEGYIYVVDRRKDIIISGGENISSREVEEAIYRHPAVKECAVIAIPDPQWGETVAALVVAKPGEVATEEEIIQVCQENLASYKKPRLVAFLESLPRTPMGKVMKEVLREPYWAGYERRVH